MGDILGAIPEQEIHEQAMDDGLRDLLRDGRYYPLCDLGFRHSEGCLTSIDMIDKLERERWPLRLSLAEREEIEWRVHSASSIVECVNACMCVCVCVCASVS